MPYALIVTRSHPKSFNICLESNNLQVRVNNKGRLHQCLQQRATRLLSRVTVHRPPQVLLGRVKRAFTNDANNKLTHTRRL